MITRPMVPQVGGQQEILVTMLKNNSTYLFEERWLGATSNWSKPIPTFSVLIPVWALENSPLANLRLTDHVCLDASWPQTGLSDVAVL